VELETAISAAREAGAAIRDLYERAAAAVSVKDDGSYVTDADLAADAIIRRRMGTAFPADAILTEEGRDDRARLSADRCWIVDPIDGTKQFVTRTGEFDVLIALVVAGRPVVGVVCQPTTDLILAAAAGAGAWRESGGPRVPLRLAAVPATTPPRIVTSVWMGAPANSPTFDRIAARLGAAPPPVWPFGINPRAFVPPANAFDALLGQDFPDRVMDTWEWDFAAPDIIVREAGGVFSDAAGQPHRYNKPLPRNLGGVLLAPDAQTHRLLVEAVRSATLS
jgi:3'-phosphoadenosine 5'-phosphosulfate (PAPS) 3'-phosphatase